MNSRDHRAQRFCVHYPFPFTCVVSSVGSFESQLNEDGGSVISFRNLMHVTRNSQKTLDNLLVYTFELL